MKNLKSLLLGDTARLIFCALIVFLCTYCLFPSAGIVATLPLLVVAGLLLPFLYKRAGVLVVIAALSAILLTLVLTEGFDAAVFYTIVPTLFFLCAYFVSRLLALFHKGKERRIGALCGVVGAIVLIGMWHVVFSNPLTLIQTTDACTALYNEHYTHGDDVFTASEAHYDPLTRKHRATYRYRDLSFSADENEDGFLNTMKARTAENQRIDLLKLLHDEFSDGNYRVRIIHPKGEPFSQSFCYEAPPEEWLWENDVILEFEAAVSVGTPDARAAFARRVRLYKDCLDESGFPYKSFTIRGGEYDEMVYELSFTPETKTETLVAPTVTDLTR